MEKALLLIALIIGLVKGDEQLKFKTKSYFFMNDIKDDYSIAK